MNDLRNQVFRVAQRLEYEELPTGTLFVRTVKGNLLLDGIDSRDLSAITQAIDGQRTLDEVIASLSPPYDVESLMKVLERLVPGVLEPVVAAHEAKLTHGAAALSHRTRVYVIGDGAMASALASSVHKRGGNVESGSVSDWHNVDATSKRFGTVVCALERVTFQTMFDVVDDCLKRDLPCLWVGVTGDRVQVGPVLVGSNRPLLERMSFALPATSVDDTRLIEKLSAMKVHDADLVEPRWVQAASDYAAALVQSDSPDLYWKGRVFGPSGVSEQDFSHDQTLQFVASRAPSLQSSATCDVAASLHRLSDAIVLPEKAPIASVGIVGGGTAGYLTALALKKHFPGMEVTLLESSQIPIIGVGEATTPLMVSFLHCFLGLDPVELYRAVRPTWKLGIRFEWGSPEGSHFNYPFGHFDPYPALAFGESLNTCGLHSLMMDARTSPLVERPNGSVLSLLNQMPFAYHLDNCPFVEYLQRCAARAGVRHVDCKVSDVRTNEDATRIESLISEDDRAFSYEMYIDCTGFRSNLLGKSLKTPFNSYAPSLFTDSAVIATVPHGGSIKPYTTATTMDSGWCWNIPQFEEDHIGYVYSSKHCESQAAIDELLQKYPEAESLKPVHFRSGRHDDFWRDNLVAVGNSYGFVEPLESTGLHMIILEIRELIRWLPRSHHTSVRKAANVKMARYWDYLRWFLSIHYRFNKRLDSAFWRDCRDRADISGIRPNVDLFREAAPLRNHHALLPVQDLAYGIPGIDMLLLGQQVDANSPPPDVSESGWRLKLKLFEHLANAAMPQRKAIELLRSERGHELLRSNVSSPNSWVRPVTEFLRHSA